MLTTVMAFREPWEAHMFSSRLNAEGIPAVVSLEYHVGNAWHYSVALGGARVQVPGDCLAEARAIANSCRNGEFNSLLEVTFGAADDIHYPVCGSMQYWQRRPILGAAAAIAISLSLGIVLPPTGWVCFCEKCGTKFDPRSYRRAAGTRWFILAAIGCELVILSALSLSLWFLATRQYGFDSLFLIAIIALALLRIWVSNSDPDEEST